MTQNNLYMENDELRLYVDVQPLTIDVLENSKNEAAASAEDAKQSAESASNALSSMIDYKNRLEIFYAQASDNLSSLLNNAIESIINTKNTVLSTIQTLGETVLSNINNTFNEVKNSIQTLGQSYVNQAKNYADEAKDIADNIVSLEHINQYKALETGDISSDNNVLPWIRKMNRSTFDRSKFTVVGSPNITDDGIASGLGGNDFIKISAVSQIGSEYKIDVVCKITDNLPSSNQWIVIVPLRVGSSSPVFGVGINGTNKKFASVFRNQATGSNQLILSDVTPLTNNSYRLTAISDLNTYVRFYINGELVAQQSFVGSGQTFNSERDIYIGGFPDVSYAYVNLPFTSGSIDLKQFSITVDGVEVFSGNKTGIDTIKPDNYTVVGTPTISADGIASGCGVNNYIKIIKNISGNLQIIGKFNFNLPSYDGYEYLVASEEQYGFVFGIKGNGHSTIFISSNNTSWDIANDIEGSKIYQSKKDYWFKLIFNQNGFYLYSSEDKENWDLDTTVNSVISPNYQGLRLGKWGTSTSAFLGLIDLNSFKIYVDGNLVYQPCLKIPYTESKTGSKIVGVNYRECVKDMYEQFGYAPYYTLSDTDFTLPQGELYGMLENLRKLIIERTPQTQGD